MSRIRITGIVCLGALFAPLLLLHAQPDAPRKEAQAMLKGIKGTLHSHKPADEVLESLKTLQAVADEVQSTQNQVAALLGHADPNVRMQAAQTLVASSQRPDIAPYTVEFLTKRLNRESNPEVVAWILRSLARMGPYAKPEIPRFIEALKNPDPRIRRAAAAIFWAFQKSDELIPVAIAALDDPDLGPDEKSGGASWSAMVYLWGRRSAAKDAAPGLIKIAKSEKGSEHYRFRALWTLAAVAPEERLPLDTARKWLKRTDDHKILINATGVLSELGVHAKDAVPDLIALANLNSSEGPAVDMSIKMSVVGVLGRVGPAAKEALPTLEMIATTTNNRILRDRVVEAIKAIHGK